MEDKGKFVVCVVCKSCPCIAGCGARAVGAYGEKPKMCRCGAGHCKILTSKKDQSLGRRFYCCPWSSGANNHGCGMFEWVTYPGHGAMSSGNATLVEVQPKSPPRKMNVCTTSYARGYLDGAIRGSEQQTVALRNILDALTKLDVNKK